MASARAKKLKGAGAQIRSSKGMVPRGRSLAPPIKKSGRVLLGMPRPLASRLRPILRRFQGATQQAVANLLRELDPVWVGRLDDNCLRQLIDTARNGSRAPAWATKLRFLLELNGLATTTRGVFKRLLFEARRRCRGLPSTSLAATEGWIEAIEDALRVGDLEAAICGVYFLASAGATQEGRARQTKAATEARRAKRMLHKRYEDEARDQWAQNQNLSIAACARQVVASMSEERARFGMNGKLLSERQVRKIIRPLWPRAPHRR
jgi:hypothetical protein